MSTLTDFSDPQQYQRLENEWLIRWQRIMDKTGQELQWQVPWFDQALGKGSPIQDGNPIFSAVCPTKRIGVRIIQQNYPAPTLNKWMDVFAKDEPEETRELVIVCSLHQASMDQACGLLEQWVSDGGNLR